MAQTDAHIATHTHTHTYAQPGRSRDVESIHTSGKGYRGLMQLDADIEPSSIRRLLKYFPHPLSSAPTISKIEAAG